ncbi:MAG: hypothetical protein QGI05_02440, partial [Candidatus Omnitrophota bacterium]|nr:hypothetical protein [Candidatus Omnitrophota bacterium]
HMLTTEAFNALLKTLEEPPAHVKFIFATTEPHKLLPTIVSRCQRFDFRRISVRDIVAKLQNVAVKEKLDIDKDVFLYIAKASDGSMRDAESILDQVSSFSKGKVRLLDVIESLGMIEQDTLFRCADLIIERDTKSSIHLIAEILDSGKDVKQFLIDVLEHFRNIMIAKTGVSPADLIDLPNEAIERVKTQAKVFSQGDIFYIINTISNSLRMIKQLLPERIVLELCMIKLTSRDSIASIEEILSKLSEITKLSNTASNPAPARSVAKVVGPTLQKTLGEKLQQAVRHVTKIDSPKKPLIQRKGASVDMTKIKDAWPILVKAMAVKRMSISSYLAEGEPEDIKGDVILVGFPKELNFHREVLEEKQNKDSVEAALSQILDSTVRLQFILTDRKLEEKKPEKTLLTKEELKNKEPVIDAVLDVFGG